MNALRFPTRHRLAVMLPLLLLAQLGLVAAGSWPQLSARALGEEIRLRVRPVDPIDPFRGAYVALSYPDLRGDGIRRGIGNGAWVDDGDDSGTLFVTLERGTGDDEDVWVASGWSRERPEDGTYLRCIDRFGAVRCGIESWFLPQDEAKRVEKAVAGGTVVATITVDSRGNAAVVGLSEG